MALKTIVLLLACALVARSQSPTKQCSVDDLTGEIVLTVVKQIIETLVQDVKSFNSWVDIDCQNAIRIGTSEVLLLSTSRISRFEAALECAEAPPVNQTDLQGCYDPRPDLQNITKSSPIAALNCINSYKDDLLAFAATYKVDTARADQLMDQATTVALTCKCRSGCLGDLIKILKEAERLSRNVSSLYYKLAMKIADFTRNIHLCIRNENLRRTLKWYLALQKRTSCIEDKYKAVSRRH